MVVILKSPMKWIHWHIPCHPFGFGPMTLEPSRKQYAISSLFSDAISLPRQALRVTPFVQLSFFFQNEWCQECLPPLRLTFPHSTLCMGASAHSRIHLCQVLAPPWQLSARFMHLFNCSYILLHSLGDHLCGGTGSWLRILELNIPC